MTTPSNPPAAEVSVVVPVGRFDDDVATQVAALSKLALRDGDRRRVEIVLVANSADVEHRERLESVVAATGDARIRVVPATAGRGASYARNAGVAASSGSILAFCDADDIVEEGWLAEMLAGLDTYDAVGGRLIDFGLTPEQAAARPPATPDALPTFLGVPYIVSASLALRRDAFERVGGFDETLRRCEDIAISWKLIVDGATLGYVEAARIHYRHRPGVLPMLRQHYHYGVGMAQVLARYGIPGEDGWQPVDGRGSLRPNGQPGGRRSWAGLARRGALAAGRVAGIVSERWRRWRRGSTAPTHATGGP